MRHKSTVYRGEGQRSSQGWRPDIAFQRGEYPTKNARTPNYIFYSLMLFLFLSSGLCHPPKTIECSEIWSLDCLSISGIYEHRSDRFTYNGQHWDWDGRDSDALETRHIKEFWSDTLFVSRFLPPFATRDQRSFYFLATHFENRRVRPPLSCIINVTAKLTIDEKSVTSWGKWTLGTHNGDCPEFPFGNYYLLLELKDLQWW